VAFCVISQEMVPAVFWSSGRMCALGRIYLPLMLRDPFHLRR
jgi:hypothetical protein